MNLKENLLITRQQIEEKLALEVKKDVLTLIQSEVEEIKVNRTIRERLIENLMEGLDPHSDDPLGRQGTLKLLEIIDKGTYERVGSIISGMKSGIVINNNNSANSASVSRPPSSSEVDVTDRASKEELDVFKKFLSNIKSIPEETSVNELSSPILDVTPIQMQPPELLEPIEKEVKEIEMPQVEPSPLVFRMTDAKPPIRKKEIQVEETLDIDVEQDDSNDKLQ